MRRNTMFDQEREPERAVRREGTGDSRRSFDCCDTRMSDAMAVCPCGSVMRRHPVVMSAILAVMGLGVLVIPVGAILGIIAFLRTV